jgi:hypothetical protein
MVSPGRRARYNLRVAYRPEILEQLAIHGILPKPSTNPELVRAYLSDLYRYEIRRLKGRLLAGEFARDDYFPRVVQLRLRYPLLSIPVHLWMR